MVRRRRGLHEGRPSAERFYECRPRGCVLPRSVLCIHSHHGALYHSEAMSFRRHTPGTPAKLSTNSILNETDWRRRSQAAPLSEALSCRILIRLCNCALSLGPLSQSQTSQHQNVLSNREYYRTCTLFSKNFDTKKLLSHKILFGPLLFLFSIEVVFPFPLLARQRIL
jgi:hypothetical protein